MISTHVETSRPMRPNVAMLSLSKNMHDFYECCIFINRDVDTYSLYFIAPKAHSYCIAICLCEYRAFAMAYLYSSDSRPLAGLQPQLLAGLQSTRKCNSFFRYPKESEAAFMVLKDDTMSGEDLYRVLEGVPGVATVYWQTCINAQYFIEPNVMVKSSLFKKPFEFELTRSTHTKNMGTCSMAFKKAPAGQLLEAWRILRLAVGDRGLASHRHEVEKWHKDTRLQHSEHEKSVRKAVPLTPKKKESSRFSRRRFEYREENRGKLRRRRRRRSGERGRR
jgi:hypothetical protein